VDLVADPSTENLDVAAAALPAVSSEPILPPLDATPLSPMMDVAPRRASPSSHRLRPRRGSRTRRRCRWG
jgi:hypothetical protein